MSCLVSRLWEPAMAVRGVAAHTPHNVRGNGAGCGTNKQRSDYSTILVFYLIPRYFVYITTHTEATAFRRIVVSLCARRTVRQGKREPVPLGRIVEGSATMVPLSFIDRVECRSVILQRTFIFLFVRKPHLQACSKVPRRNREEVLD